MREAQWAERCLRNEPPASEEHRRRPDTLPPATADAEWWKGHAVCEEGPARPCAKAGCARHASRFHHPEHGIPYVTCGTKCEESISGSAEWVQAVIKIGTQFYGLLAEGTLMTMGHVIAEGIMDAIEPAVSARFAAVDSSQHAAVSGSTKKISPEAKTRLQRIDAPPPWQRYCRHYQKEVHRRPRESAGNTCRGARIRDLRRRQCLE